MKMLISKLLIPTKTKRKIFFLLVDTITFIFSFIFSYFLVFKFNISKSFENVILYWLAGFVILKILIFFIFKLYSINWRFVGITEFIKITFGVFVSSTLLFLIDIFLQYNGLSNYVVPKNIIIIDFFISLFFVSLVRIAKRAYIEIFSSEKGTKRTLIIGAGSSGEKIVRSLKSHPEYIPIGFLDDDPKKIGTFIHGIPVYGEIKNAPKIIENNEIETVIIAISSLNQKKLREIYNILQKTGIKDIKIVPNINKLPKESITIKDIKDISIEDLLCREPIEIEKKEIEHFLNNKSILVSGAGGSIGSEIVRQLIKFKPKKIIALEIDETELYNLYLEIKNQIEEKNILFKPVVCDVRDKNKLKRIFSQEHPDIVFHAAAYKHVPLMEFFPEEAVKTNIIGTYNIANVSIETGVTKFINISTDKAVNPTSVMGATKRVAEMICRGLNSLGKTKFISVRFGNVLGSRGSVIPIFLEQIKKGGPITVTHPEITRYFMTIPEAVLLVFQASSLGKGGEIFVLDMGEPVRITRLAEELIKLQGLEPYKDIDIVFSGLRPGEKLYEELFTEKECTERSKYQKILIAKISDKLTLKEIESIIKKLKYYIYTNPQELKNVLFMIIDGSYKISENKNSKVKI